MTVEHRRASDIAFASTEPGTLKIVVPAKCDHCHRTAIVRLTYWGPHDIDLCGVCVERVYAWLVEQCTDPVL